MEKADPQLKGLSQSKSFRAEDHRHQVKVHRNLQNQNNSKANTAKILKKQVDKTIQTAGQYEPNHFEKENRYTGVQRPVPPSQMRSKEAQLNLEAARDRGSEINSHDPAPTYHKAKGRRELLHRADPSLEMLRSRP